MSPAPTGRPINGPTKARIGPKAGVLAGEPARRGRGWAAAMAPLVWTSDILSELIEVAVRALRWSTWKRQPIRREIVREIDRSGVRSVPVVIVAALVLGLGASQLVAFLAGTGSGGIAPGLAFALITQSAPLVVSAILIVRAGALIVIELATVRASGQDRMLATHGIDAFAYFVFPRVLGLAFSGLALTCAFLATGFFGLAAGLLASPAVGITPTQVLDEGFEALALSTAVAMAINATLPAGVTALVACRVGLSIDSALAEVPRVLPAYATQVLVATATIALATRLTL